MRTHARQLGSSLLGFLLLVVAAGCGSQGSGGAAAIVDSVVPVSGKVRYADGRPVANAWVVLHPKSPPGNEASAATAADGTFQLGTFGKADGAVPGRYVVTVEPHPNAKTSVPQIPKKYTAEQTSTLTAEITNNGAVTLSPFDLK